jgi:hypothetical protein
MTFMTQLTSYQGEDTQSLVCIITRNLEQNYTELCLQLLFQTANKKKDWGSEHDLQTRFFFILKGTYSPSRTFGLS